VNITLNLILPFCGLILRLMLYFMQHRIPQYRVDSRLITRALGFEPIQDLTVQANGDGGFWLGKSEHGTLEEGLA